MKSSQNSKSPFVTLPSLMVAPNGARRTKNDHHALPVTIPEITLTAKECFSAGAHALHAHVRDAQQQHVLDAALYKELIQEISIHVPKMSVQITTESLGLYSPIAQQKLVKDVHPKMVSIALKEMLSEDNTKDTSRFYHFMNDAHISCQHILYSPEECLQFITLTSQRFFPSKTPQLLFVLGRTTKDHTSKPHELDPFLHLLHTHNLQADWALCAFGKNETLCARYAFQKGGKARIGFENSLWNHDGSLAQNNKERILEVAAIRDSLPTACI